MGVCNKRCYKRASKVLDGGIITDTVVYSSVRD